MTVYCPTTAGGEGVDKTKNRQRDLAYHRLTPEKHPDILIPRWQSNGP